MQMRPFGPAGLDLPVLGQGSWEMEQDDREQAIAALRRGVELGMTHLDTAEMYGSGRVEEIVGEAIRGLRDRVFLASKVLPSNASFKGTVEACERSLRHLKTDRLDLYLLHWAGSHPLEDTFRAFEKLQKEGKVRFYGVSNFDVDEMEKAVRMAGEGKVACNQVLYNLGERTIEHALIPWCERHHVAVVAYTPLGSSKFPAPASKGGKVLEAVAAAHRATPRQVALAFVTRRPSVFAIPKSSRVEHVEENAGAAPLRLSPEELSKIEASFPLAPWRGLQML